MFVSGAEIDTRPESEKQRDYRSAELVAAATPVNWTEKPQNVWRKFPIFNQDGSGSCVAQTEAKELGIMRWLKDRVYVHFSATHIYQQRANKPGGGMGAVDACNLASKGATLEVLTPSQGMSDAEMDAVQIEDYKKKVGEIFAVPNYLALPIKDIDAIASVIQATSKGVMVWFYFELEEWTSQPFVKNPNLELSAPATNRHSVTAVDFTLVNGKKALIIEDSWGTSYGMAGQRVITEDFFKARNWYAGYLMNFKFDQVQPTKPHYTFAKDLVFIEWDSVKNQPKDPATDAAQKADVIALQDILKYEGLFPNNSGSTGYYGAITAKAVLAFQRKYQVADEAELVELGGKKVGSKTRAILNQLYQ